MMLFIVKLWLVANAVVFAESPQGGQNSVGKSCSEKDLKRWDCRLQLGKAVVHVTKQKILLSDGVWRAVDDIPMDKIQEWDQVRLQKLGSRLFLILSFWDEGQGETKIQSRIWWVVEISGVTTSVKVKQLAQRRTAVSEKKADGDTVKPGGVGPTYIMDKAEPTELKLVKGEVVWRVGREHGVIEKGIDEKSESTHGSDKHGEDKKAEH